MRRIIIATAIAALAPVAAWSAVSKPGLYALEFQQVCLLADQTWYGTTFPGWSGMWQSGKNGTELWGNYAEGVGNDAIAVGTEGKGYWREWRDDMSYQILITGAKFTMISTECPSAVSAVGSAANPSAR